MLLLGNPIYIDLGSKNNDENRFSEGASLQLLA